MPSPALTLTATNGCLPCPALQFLYMHRMKECYLFKGVQQRFLDALLASARVEIFMPGRHAR